VKYLPVYILLLPSLLSADQAIGTWFSFEGIDPVFDYFFSLSISAGLPVFVVVALATAVMSDK
jgi:hypothetical protein